MEKPAIRPAVSLRERLCAREPLLGMFQKLGAYHATELLGGSGLDYVVLDAEHAVFSRRELDGCVLAARAAGMPCLLRLPDASEHGILAALDMGATGVVVPHVSDAAQAGRVVAAAHYTRHGGKRGYSNSPRAGGFGGRGMREHIDDADSTVVVLCQIEDRAGVSAIGDIAAVAGIHGLLVGPADLMLSYGQDSLRSPVMADALGAVTAAGRANGVAVGIALPKLDEAGALAARGFSFFLVGSDQSLITQGANALVQGFQGHVKHHIGETA